MKKLYSLMTALVLSIGFISAQCTINPSAQTTPGANPTAHDLPCIERTVAYNQTVQGKIQTSGDTSITIGTCPLCLTVNAHLVVDSVKLDSITHLPVGIIAGWSPVVLPGGGNGCVNFSGTTTDTVGTYNLIAWGKVWFHAQATILGQNIDTPYSQSGNLNRFSPFGNYYLVVVNQGAACVHPSGINDFSPDLNAALSVYPNPNNGSFELRLNAGSRVNGEVVIVDATGRKVFTQSLDVIGLYSTKIDLSGYAKGIYTVQLRTAEGFASKNVSIE